MLRPLPEQALELLEPGGAVVFLGSTLALRPVETSAVYSASKAGLLAAMRSLALAGAARSLRFNAVCPGVVDTEMTRALRLEAGEAEPGSDERRARTEAQLEALRALHPLGRLGTAEEVAQALADPDVARDTVKLRSLGREHTRLAPIVKAAERLRRLEPSLIAISCARSLRAWKSP